jgi:hypothetical protein
MSLLHRRHHDGPSQDAVAPPPSAPAPAAPPSPEEIEETSALAKLKHQLDDGDITQAEFDAHKDEARPGS